MNLGLGFRIRVRVRIILGLGFRVRVRFRVRVSLGLGLVKFGSPSTVHRVYSQMHISCTAAVYIAFAKKISQKSEFYDFSFAREVKNIVKKQACDFFGFPPFVCFVISCNKLLLNFVLSFGCFSILA